MTGQYERHSWPEELALDDDLGPAPHITRTKADAMIANALLEAGFAPAPVASTQPQAQVSTAAAPAQRKRRSFLWQVAAATLFAFVGMGSASAAVMLWKRVVHPEPVVTQLPIEKPHAKKHREKPVEPVVEAQVEAPVIEPVVIEADKPEKRKPARKPEDFLDDANRLRAEKRWRDADENYARVWQAAPNSSAAYVARVASAAVRLEHLHDPKTALARYRAALDQAPRGALLEEIRFGIAECWRARGNRSEERKALEAFVHDHPGSGLASKARARLTELSAK
jgi:hypothetical protein